MSEDNSQVSNRVNKAIHLLNAPYFPRGSADTDSVKSLWVIKDPIARETNPSCCKNAFFQFS